MGVLGNHVFEGEFRRAVGAGCLQERHVACRAAIEAGAMVAVRPPSAGTRTLYGWGVQGMIGWVRPLVEGEASMWDRHLRRVMLSGEDAAAAMHKGCAALASVMRVYGRESAGDDEGRRRWDKPRDQRLVPGDVSARGRGGGAGVASAAVVTGGSDLPEGWTAVRMPSGATGYEHVDGRMQAVRPTSDAALPAGWIHMIGGGTVMYYHAATGRMQTERPMM